MLTIRCRWGDMHRHGPLWYNHLKLRKRVFVDGSGWDVPHTDSVEWDQFDTPETEYFITHCEGRVLASSRAIPCSLDTPQSSYMIRDACRGLLPGIPPSIFETPPLSADVWEATRFAVSPDIPDKDKRTAMRHNAWALIEGCEARGAKTVLALMPPGFVAWFKRDGIPAERAGPVTRNSDGEKFCVIRVSTEFVSQREKLMIA